MDECHGRHNGSRHDCQQNSHFPGCRDGFIIQVSIICMQYLSLSMTCLQELKENSILHYYNGNSSVTWVVVIFFWTSWMNWIMNQKHWPSLPLHQPRRSMYLKNIHSIQSHRVMRVHVPRERNIVGPSHLVALYPSSSVRSHDRQVVLLYLLVHTFLFRERAHSSSTYSYTSNGRHLTDAQPTVSAPHQTMLKWCKHDANESTVINPGQWKV